MFRKMKVNSKVKAILKINTFFLKNIIFFIVFHYFFDFFNNFIKNLKFLNNSLTFNNQKFKFKCVNICCNF